MILLNRATLCFASLFLFIFFKAVCESTMLCTKSDNVNGRNGPGINFAIIYKISKKGYPVKVIDKLDNWVAVEDFKGDKMWISSSNLTSKCGRIVKCDSTAEVRVSPTESANIIFVLNGGFILEKATCYAEWCSVKVENKTGWVLKSSLWNSTH